MATPFGTRDEGYGRWEGDGRDRDEEERRYGREYGGEPGRESWREYGRRFGRDEDRGYGRDMGYGREYGREGGMYGGGGWGREGGYGREMGYGRDFGREGGRYGREVGYGGGFYGRDIGYGRDMGGVGPESEGFGYGRGYGMEERRVFEPRSRYGGPERAWGAERGYWGPERGYWGPERGYWGQGRGSFWGHGREQGEGPGLMERMREGMRRLGGRGPKGYKRPDSRIMEDVCESIARSDIDAQNVDVAVNDGEVTLSGFVSDRRDKRALEDIAEGIFAVKEVHNRIRVSHGGVMGTERATSGTQTAGTPSGTQHPGNR